MGAAAVTSPIVRHKYAHLVEKSKANPCIIPVHLCCCQIPWVWMNPWSTMSTVRSYVKPGHCQWTASYANRALRDVFWWAVQPTLDSSSVGAVYAAGDSVECRKENLGFLQQNAITTRFLRNAYRITAVRTQYGPIAGHTGRPDIPYNSRCQSCREEGEILRYFLCVCLALARVKLCVNNSLVTTTKDLLVVGWLQAGFEYFSQQALIRLPRNATLTGLLTYTRYNRTIII